MYSIIVISSSGLWTNNIVRQQTAAKSLRGMLYFYWHISAKVTVTVHYIWSHNGYRHGPFMSRLHHRWYARHKHKNAADILHYGRLSKNQASKPRHRGSAFCNICRWQPSRQRHHFHLSWQSPVLRRLLSPRYPDIKRRIRLASLSNVWNSRHLSIPTKIRVYQALVTSVLLYVAETWTVLASDLKTLEAFHMKCQRQILKVNWQQFIHNEEITATTGLPSMSDIISCRRNAVFGHIARLDTTTVPAHQALRAHVNLSLGWNPDPRWKRWPGQPRCRWIDQIRKDSNDTPPADQWRHEIGRGHGASIATAQAGYALNDDECHPAMCDMITLQGDGSISNKHGTTWRVDDTLCRAA